MTYISTINLSARARNALINADIKTVEQLLALDPQKLRGLENCGQVTIAEIKGFIDGFFCKDAEKLIGAAELLETQAQFLRELASRIRQANLGSLEGRPA